jgi:hypothetical protein
VPAPPDSSSSGGNAPSDRVSIDWTSIRALATMFDEIGDDIERKITTAVDLAGTGSLVGDDDDGVAFAEWYAEGFHAQLVAIRNMSGLSFSVAAGVHDFEKFWDMLEENIVTSLPVITNLSKPPIPELPPAKTGA